MTPTELDQVVAGSRYTCSQGCHWTGRARAHCSGCHTTYNTAGGFDSHRQATAGRNRCLDPVGVRNKNGDLLLQIRDGIWYARRDGERPPNWAPTKEAP